MPIIILYEVPIMKNLCCLAGVIEVYDLDTGDWSTVERYPQDIWEHLCATLYIPKCRDDMEVMQELQRS